jgi:hypothetical protein
VLTTNAYAGSISDSFDSTDGVFSVADSETWSIEAGRLFFYDPSGVAGYTETVYADVSKNTNLIAGDFSASVLASGEGGDAGFVYGLQAFCVDSSNGTISDSIRIAVTPGVYRIDKNNGLGATIVDWTQSSTVTGKDDLLKLEKKDETLKFYINDQQVATTDLEPCSHMLIGLFSSSNVEASFDDFFAEIPSLELPPVAPVISLSVEGINVSLAWEPVDNTEGYFLVYAPYPYSGPDSIEYLPIGNQTSFSAGLWPDAAYYVAVVASNRAGVSGCSNLKLIEIGNKLSLAITLAKSTSVGKKFSAYIDYLQNIDKIITYDDDLSSGGSAHGFITSFDTGWDGGEEYIACDWGDSRIEINERHSVEYMASAIVHEISHYEDLVTASNNLDVFLNIGETELLAHANQYLFFLQANLLNDSIYTGLHEARRNGMEKCYNYIYDNGSKADAQSALIAKGYSSEKQTANVKIICVENF